MDKTAPIYINSRDETNDAQLQLYQLSRASRIIDTSEDILLLSSTTLRALGRAQSCSSLEPEQYSGAVLLTQYS